MIAFTNWFNGSFSQRKAICGAWVVVLWGCCVALLQAEEAKLTAAVKSIKKDDLQYHVKTLANDTFEGRQAGSRGGRAAGVYLVKEMEKHQLAPAGNDGYFQSFGPLCRNILGRFEGTDPQLKQEVIVIGAHYDHVGYGNQQNSFGPIGYIHNGADDNASGTAALLEVMEAFAQHNIRTKRTLLFALWDSEENGLLGSKHWMSHPTVPLSQLKLGFNLDMVGRLRDQKLEVLGVRTAAGLRALASRQNTDKLNLFFNWELKDDSDHHSFFSRNIPVLMLHTGLHDDYHRPSDDAEKVNVEGMEQVTQFLFRLLVDTGDRPVLPGFRRESLRETPNSQKLVEAPLPPLPGRLGVAWRGLAAEGGFVVTGVAAGSAASRAGVRTGDRLLKFNGTELNDEQTFQRLVLHAPTASTLSVARTGQEEPLELPLELGGSPVRVGISWRTDDGEPGVVFLNRVIPLSPAADAQLQVGDRILSVASRPFADSETFLQLLNAHNGPTALEIERSGQIISATLHLPAVVEKSAE